MLTTMKAVVTITRAGVAVFQSLSSAWNSALSVAANFVVKLESIPAQLEDLPGELLRLGGRIVESFKEGLFAKVDEIKNTVKSKIMSLIPEVPSLSSVGNSISSFLASATRRLRSLRRLILSPLLLQGLPIL